MAKHSYALQGKVAVVTGAASGIGAALATALAAKGCKLALADWNEAGLKTTAAALAGAELMTTKLDVSDRAAVLAFADAVKARFGAVHLVFNNAGVSVADTVIDHSQDDFEWIMGVNFWGVVHGTKAFLPLLLAQKDGVIVNTSSIFGIIGFPNNASYCASKFAVRGFTESLRGELDLRKAIDPALNVHALLVHPGNVKTGIVVNGRFHKDATGNADQAKGDALFQRMPGLMPAQAAAIIVDGVGQLSPRILVGKDAKLLARIQKWFPASYFRVLGAILKRRTQR